MKKHAKRLSILLALTLIFTSFEFVGVFATDNEPTEQMLEQPTETQQAPALLATEGEGDGEGGGEEVELKAPAAPEVQTFSSYQSVALEWAKVTKDAEGNDYGEDVVVKYKVNGQDVGTATSWHSAFNLDPYGSYAFTVEAYIDGKPELSASATAWDSPVRPMRYVLKIKRKGTLKSHGGPKQKLKVTKGMVIYADRFQTGKYIFDYNGSRFQVARTRVGKKYADYTHAFDYSAREAEYYVNDRGLGSSTGVLIWVNTFTQHVYYFNRGGAGWVCADNWDCSTGTASTPTPTGTNGLKSLKKKIKKKNGIRWWSTFNGNAALHGRKKNKQVGSPASNGCVRNPDEKAWVVYAYAGKGTRVVIY